MKQRFCKSCGKWHDVEKPWPLKCIRYTKSNAPYVISDIMEPLKHHGSGRLISSKREFSKETRAMGMVEIGNEVPKARKPIKLDNRQRAEDIKRAIYDLRNR